jgi:hypothetical protein
MRACLFAALISAICGCGANEAPAPAASTNELSANPTPPPPPPQPPAAQPTGPVPTTDKPVDKPSPDNIGFPKAGWSKFKQTDDVPLCAFVGPVQREAAKLVEQVKPAKLAAKRKVTFGTFAPGCVNSECEDLPSMQCWVDTEAHTLVVHSSYYGYRKDGAKCSEDCKPVTAGCDTPELDAGEYTVQYGERKFKLKIPSTLNKPCFPLQ